MVSWCGHGELCMHPPLHTPAAAVSGHHAAHTHCWWRGDVSSSHTSRWSHTACRAELPLVKRFQWRAVIGPDTIFTRIGKCLHYNYVSRLNRAARTSHLLYALTILLALNCCLFFYMSGRTKTKSAVKIIENRSKLT